MCAWKLRVAWRPERATPSIVGGVPASAEALKWRCGQVARVGPQPGLNALILGHSKQQRTLIHQLEVLKAGRMVVNVADCRVCGGGLIPLCWPVKSPRHPLVQLQTTKRTLQVVAGEGRSANRTKWPVATAPIPPAVMQTANTRSSSESSAADVVSSGHLKAWLHQYVHT